MMVWPICWCDPQFIFYLYLFKWQSPFIFINGDICFVDLEVEYSNYIEVLPYKEKTHKLICSLKYKTKLKYFWIGSNSYLSINF